MGCPVTNQDMFSRSADLFIFFPCWWFQKRHHNLSLSLIPWSLRLSLEDPLGPLQMKMWPTPPFQTTHLHLFSLVWLRAWAVGQSLYTLATKFGFSWKPEEKKKHTYIHKNWKPLETVPFHTTKSHWIGLARDLWARGSSTDGRWCSL